MQIQPTASTRQIADSLWGAGDEHAGFVIRRRFRAGRYTLSCRASTVDDVAPTSMKVYFADDDGEFPEEHAVVLGRLPTAGESDLVEVTFDIPYDTAAVRFDPVETACRFRFSELAVKRKSPLLRAARAAKMVASQFLKSPRGLISDVEKYLGKRTLAPTEAGLDRRHTVAVPADLPQ